MATGETDDSTSSGKDKGEKVEETPSKVNTPVVENDTDSHYFIHPNDTTMSGAVTPLLDTSNYHTWHKTFQIQMRLKNKMGFIDGSLEQPGLFSPNLRAWKKCNTLVLSWMMHNVSNELKKCNTVCRNGPRGLGYLER